MQYWAREFHCVNITYLRRRCRQTVECYFKGNIKGNLCLEVKMGLFFFFLSKPASAFMLFPNLTVKMTRRGNKEALTLWINPAEWMYCFDRRRGGAGQEDGGRREGRREREREDIKRDRGQQCSSPYSPPSKRETAFICLMAEQPVRLAAGLIQC